MTKQGAVILGIGGDNSKGATGTFYEGVMTSGYPSDSTENSVQANITAAGYGGQTGGGTGTQTNAEVVGGQSGRCVDVPNGVTTNGTQVQLYDCWGGTSQRWTYTSSKQLQVYGNKVQMWDCDGNAAAQNWTVSTSGTLTIDGGCLDITGANFSNGTLVELWTCNGGSNQQWQAVNGQLVNPASGKCLDDPNSNTADGTQLILWACNGGSNQQWHLP